MSFQQVSDLAQIIASIGVIVSLIFVGLQIRHNTGALQRNEHNATMAQWTVIRMAIAKDRDIAELMTAGIHGERSMDAAGIRLGVFPHLGQNSTRCLSERNFRSNGRSDDVRFAPYPAWRGVVVQRQTCWLYSRICR